MAHLRKLSVLIATLTLLAGCGGSAAAPSQPASSAAPAKPASSAAAPTASASAQPAGSSPAKPAASAAGTTKLTIIYSANSVDQTPAWAALDGGYFKQNGLDVNMEYVAGGTKTTAALIAGQAQVSLQGGNEAMSAVSNGSDLVLIAGLLPVYGFKVEAAPKRTDIKTVADLKGKKLGVSTIGGTADVALRSFLKKNGIDPDKDVTIIATGDPTTTQGALTSGAVDASMAVPPNSLIAEKAGTHPIADLASIPNAENSVTVRRDWLDANKPVAQELVDSLIEGLARIKKDKAFTEGLWKKYLKFDDQEGLDYTYDFFSTKIWPEYPHIKADQLADGLAVLSQKNEKLKNFDVNKMLDDSFVQDAEKRGVASKV